MEQRVPAPVADVTGHRLQHRQGRPALSIVIPFRSIQRGALAALVARWTPVAGDRIEVIICDGSPRAAFDQYGHSAWRGLRHLPVDRSCYSYVNDKVNGLCTGVAAARADAVLICDDDCDLTPEHLDDLLDTPLADQVFKIPTYSKSFNFLESLEAVRSMICYGISRHGDPSPVYLACRSTMLASLRHPVGDCLFDDYMLEKELRRAIAVVTHSEVRLRRDAAPLGKWAEQQVRYAYEDLSAVPKTTCFLALPWLIGFLATLGVNYLVMALVLLVAVSCSVAALGLHRYGLPDRCPAWIICLGACIL